MADFKKLSEVEVVAEPMETANVLIEENGVIKKAPKTAVGGSGGGNNYLAVTFYEKSGGWECSATYDEIYDVFRNCKGLSVTCFTASRFYCIDSFMYESNDDSFYFCYPASTTKYIRIHSDGTVAEDEEPGVPF